MRIPSVIYINSIPIGIVGMDKKSFKDLYPDTEFSIYEPKTLCIIYSHESFKVIPKEMIRNLLWHEIIHAIEDLVFGYDGCVWSEHCVQTLANAIHQVEVQFRGYND